MCRTYPSRQVGKDTSKLPSVPPVMPGIIRTRQCHCWPDRQAILARVGIAENLPDVSTGGSEELSSSPSGDEGAVRREGRNRVAKQGETVSICWPVVFCSPYRASDSPAKGADTDSAGGKGTVSRDGRAAVNRPQRTDRRRDRSEPARPAAKSPRSRPIKLSLPTDRIGTQVGPGPQLPTDATQALSSERRRRSGRGS